MFPWHSKWNPLYIFVCFLSLSLSTFHSFSNHRRRSKSIVIVMRWINECRLATVSGWLLYWNELSKSSTPARRTQLLPNVTLTTDEYSITAHWLRGQSQSEYAPSSLSSSIFLFFILTEIRDKSSMIWRQFSQSAFLRSRRPAWPHLLWTRICARQKNHAAVAAQIDSLPFGGSHKTPPLYILNHLGDPTKASFRCAVHRKCMEILHNCPLIKLILYLYLFMLCLWVDNQNVTFSLYKMHLLLYAVDGWRNIILLNRRRMRIRERASELIKGRRWLFFLSSHWFDELGEETRNSSLRCLFGIIQSICNTLLYSYRVLNVRAWHAFEASQITLFRLEWHTKMPLKMNLWFKAIKNWAASKTPFDKSELPKKKAIPTGKFHLPKRNEQPPKISDFIILVWEQRPQQHAHAHRTMCSFHFCHFARFSTFRYSSEANNGPSHALTYRITLIEIYYFFVIKSSTRTMDDDKRNNGHLEASEILEYQRMKSHQISDDDNGKILTFGPDGRTHWGRYEMKSRSTWNYSPQDLSKLSCEAKLLITKLFCSTTYLIPCGT